VEGENDVDEENMFAENDIDNSVRQQNDQVSKQTNLNNNKQIATKGIAFGTGSVASNTKTTNKSSANEAKQSNLAHGSVLNTLAKNLDNDEALKEIRNQLSEIIISTAKSSNTQQDGKNQHSILTSDETKPPTIVPSSRKINQ
jgi:hypothetical protein